MGHKLYTIKIKIKGFSILDTRYWMLDAGNWSNHEGSDPDIKSRENRFNRGV
jgi:hypothetical protein